MAARFEAEKFTGKNDFALWKMKMRAMLTQQGLASALEVKPKGAEDENLGEKVVQQRAENEAKAYSTIVLCLGDKVLREIAKEKTAAGIMAKLEDLYLTKSLANRLIMKQRLYSYKFLEGKGVLEQLEDFNKTIDDLEHIDVSIGDEDKAILLLNALPSQYNQLRDAILYGRERTVSFLEVQTALRSKELQNLEMKGGNSFSESLNVKKFKGKKPYKKQADTPKFVPNEGQKETRSCHWCKKPGHLKKDCFGWKRKQQEGGGAKAVNSIEEVEDDEPPVALNVADKKDCGSWIMDSGCSFHMSHNLSWFESMKEISGSVILGNNQICSIKGIGVIRLQIENGSSILLREVRYIPDIKRNLISLGTLEKKGCKFVSEAGVMTISKSEKLLMKAERKGSLYYMNATVQKGESEDSYALVAENLRTWHGRLGHPALGTIKELVKRGLLHCDETEEDSTFQCEECMLGKAKKLSYPRANHTSTKPLDYAHSDLWGPAQVNSIGGGKYYMSIIDDYTRKVWIYILKDKSEAFSKFRHWCIEMEAEKHTSLGCLRTDNGLEYLSREFDEFCKERGIRRHRTVPLNPQQKCVAERANRTILERTRCLLIAAGLEKRFWAEAATTAVILMNKCPSSSINGDIPDNRWFGRQCTYENLKTFGCKAFAHIKQGKLEARALKCIMLGYQPGVKGYRLWCVEPGKGKIIVSRDVVFWENDLPFKKRSDAATSDHAERSVAPGINEFEVEHGGESVDENATEAEGSNVLNPPQQSNSDVQADWKLTRDRVRRTVKPSTRYSDAEYLYFCLMAAEEVEYSEPNTYEEAVTAADSDKWKQAMIDEIDSLLKNGTWVLVERPNGRRIVSCKWIFKRKLEGADGDKVRHKARLVARGFTQEYGIDYEEVFSPVVKHTSIRVLLAIVARKDWELEQLDVKTAFLHGELKETIYMAQPKGFVKAGDENKVCLLKKAFMG